VSPPAPGSRLAGQPVTVIGAGIAGLAVSLALARRGARVRILEQAPELAEVGAGLQISPNGARVLEALGLGPALAAAGMRARAVRLLEHRAGREVTRLDLTAARGGYFFIHRADLQAMLADAARAAGARIVTGAGVAAAGPCDVGWRLTLAGGGAEDAPLLIGADGLHSVLRPTLGNGETAHFTGQVAWRATVPTDAPAAPEARVAMGPGRHLVTYPLRGGRLLNIVAVEERRAWVRESWSGRDDPGNLRAAFAGFAPALATPLQPVREVALWGLFRHPVARHWHDGAGRAAILGDAAHPTLPFLAQGANMALEDAWVLAAALDTRQATEALAAYQAARAPRCTRIVAAAEANARNYHLAGPAAMLAHAGLATLGRLAPGALLRRFDWLYGHDVTAAG